MAFTINTNIASLQSQEYLRTSSEFQQKTINRVTSGLRIISSGDDAAGLAIANSFRSDRAVLIQGVRNANDGLSTLQTIDGGLNNISQLLDRARTLAAQSASGTFNGSRAVLDGEFQTVISEIDRQAQAIGLNQNGAFAKSLSVFIGGGRASGGTSEIYNGSVGVDLSKSTVDASSLGLKGVEAANTGYDLSTGTTKVQSVVGDITNATSLSTSGYSVFRFFGPGFGNSDGIEVKVNINNVASTDSLVAAVNAGLRAAGEEATSNAAAFKNAEITAKMVTDDTGKQQLAFTSSNSAFQVVGGDRMANALLGNYSSDATGTAIASTVAGIDAATSAWGGVEPHTFRFTGGGLSGAYELSFSTTAASQAINGAALAAAVAADATLSSAGITVSNSNPDTATGLQFSARNGEKISVSVTGDTGGRWGLGAFLAGAGSAHEYASIGTGADVPIPGLSTRYTFSFNGGAGIDVNVAWDASNTTDNVTMQAAINQAINSVPALNGLGLTAAMAVGGVTTFATTNGELFRLQVSGTAGAEFGGLTGLTSFAGPNQSAAQFKGYIAAGSYQLATASGTATPLAFTGINNSTDDQALTIQANDADGASHSVAITLDSTNARSIDDALHALNQALQESNDATMQRITAVKVNDAGVEKITLVSTVPSFQLSIGKNLSGTGIEQTSVVAEAGQVGAGANAIIDTQAAAEAAVSNLAEAVEMLGAAQAVVGRGQNQFSYAISLASTQLTNLAASESRIRDADLAMEAANLAKAQVLLQAGIAALAQANSAPQAVLSLLQG